MEKKRATGLGSWLHTLSCCVLFFPASYYTWSAAWMSQESKRARRRTGKKRGEEYRENKIERKNAEDFLYCLLPCLIHLVCKHYKVLNVREM